jgi:predicted O-methyltransferase YrrM
MNFAEVPAPPVPAYQNVGEFGALWDHVAGRPHARVLEVGSLFGGTLWYWSHLPAIEQLVAVDLPSDWQPVADGVRQARGNWPEWLAPRVEFFDHQADSRDPATLAEVRRVLDGELFDVAFIDGDHTYDGVRADWLTWSPIVRPGGIVAFHDTWPNERAAEPGVVRWVDELRHHLPSIEWTDPDGVGICAFTVG